MIKVIIADDNADVRASLMLLFTEERFDVVLACDGEEAWKMLEGEHSDARVLLTDLNMPKMNGVELIGMMKREKSSVKVFLMTGDFSDEALERYGERLGTDGTYSKGTSVVALINRIRDALRK